VEEPVLEGLKTGKNAKFEVQGDNTLIDLKINSISHTLKNFNEHTLYGY
jgi:hypothetical protein